MFFIFEFHFFLKEFSNGPDLAVGQPPTCGGYHEVVLAGLDAVDETLVALVGVLLPRGQVEHLDVAQDRARVQELFVRGEGGRGENILISIISACSKRFHGPEPRVDQLPVQFPTIWTTVRGKQTLPRISGSEVQRSVSPRSGIRTFVGKKEVKFWTRGHRILAEGMLTGQVVADDADQTDLVSSVLRHIHRLVGGHITSLQG